MSDCLSIENALLPTHYMIDLDINPSKNNFKGNLRVSLKANTLARSKIQSFKMNYKDLIILSASISDSTVQNALEVIYDSTKEQATFISKTPISCAPDAELSLKLQYVGRIKAIKTYQDETTGIFKTNFMDPSTGKANNIVLATHCQPFFARHIFPCVDEPSLKTTFELTIKTLSRFKVLSNTGQLSSEPLAGSDESITKFCVTPLMATSLFGFVIGDLEVLTAELHSKHSAKQIPLSVYSPTNVESAAYALDTVQKYLPILEEFFGKSYPLEKLDFVLLPFLKDMAMENFGLITVQMNHLLLAPAVLADTQARQRVQQLIVHELVHQWMGNYISFESFEYLWFNESFATWCACDVLEKNGDLNNYWVSDEYLAEQTGSAMESDSDGSALSIVAASIKAAINSPSQTKDLFDSHSYAKGIAILRGMSLSCGETLLKKALRAVFKDESFYNNSVKPIDIIYHMANTLKSENISNFFSSWCRTAGLPIISAELVEEDGTVTTQLVQHRFLTNGQTDYEDVPYYVPLLIQLPDGELDTKHILMTDRTLKIEYPIVLCNHNAQGYYHVSYESEPFYDQINEQLCQGHLSSVDLNKIFTDLQHYIGDPVHQKAIHLIGLYKLLKHLSSDQVDLDHFSNYWPAFRTGLSALRKLESFSNSYGCFAAHYIDSIVIPLIEKIKWPAGKFEEGIYSPCQLDCMSVLIFLGRGSQRISDLCYNYFNHILQGPAGSIPIEIVESVFAVVSLNAKSIKQWRRLLELAKSCDGIQGHVSFQHSNFSNETDILQLYAVRNLCFSKDVEIIRRTLKFIADNLNIKGVDSALVGLVHSAPQGIRGDKTDIQIGEIAWEWFSTQFDEWSRACVKKGTTDDNIRSSVKGITYQIFLMVVDKPEVVDIFLKTAQDPYLKLLGVKEVWKLVRSSHVEDKKLYQETAACEFFSRNTF